MSIDWHHFTPWASLAGGIVLGLASALFILLNGRILGISGILGGLLTPRPGESSWRIAVLLGLLVSPALLSVWHHTPGSAPRASRPVGWPWWLPDCWWASVPDWGRAVPAATVCAASHACHLAHWPPR